MKSCPPDDGTAAWCEERGGGVFDQDMLHRLRLI